MCIRDSFYHAVSNAKSVDITIIIVFAHPVIVNDTKNVGITFGVPIPLRVLLPYDPETVILISETIYKRWLSKSTGCGIELG